MDKEKVINMFINDVKEVLEKENGDVVKIDLPFMVAPLLQNLYKEKYSEFILNLKDYYYSIDFIEDTSFGYSRSNGKLKIVFYLPNTSPLTYQINFTYEERNKQNGYCQCNYEDEGYREDKECCGHDCEWDAPSFELTKIVEIGSDSFEGDEHDYWDYEDVFYFKDNVKALEEEQEKILLEIDSYNERLMSIQQKLEALKA